MKKTAIIPMILSTAIFAKDNVEIKFKSDYQITKLNKYNPSVMYRPIDLKVVNNKDNYTLFFKLRGNRDNIFERNAVYSYSQQKNQLNDIIPKKAFDMKQDKYYYASDFIGWSAKKAHYHGPHEHDMALEEHDHMFDENIAHEHDPNVIGLLLPPLVKQEIIYTDLQPKFGVVYHPTRYSHLRLSYMPFIYDSDEKRYFNNFVLDGKYTKLINDNFAVIVRPEITTEKLIKPTFLELRTDLRYKVDDNTFLSAMIFNGVQTKWIKDQYNFLNSIELTYDYNTEKRRAHKFYEILDHDHEKIEQFKVSARFGHQGLYLKNNIKLDNQKVKFDFKKNIYTTDVKLDVKKPIIKNDLVFEDKFRFKNIYEKSQKSDRKYKAETFVYQDNGKTENVFGVNDDYSKFSLVNREQNVARHTIGVTTGSTKYLPEVVNRNLVLITNEAKLKYKNWEFIDNFSYTTDLKDIDANIGNTIGISYNFKLPYGFQIKPHVNDTYTYSYFRGHGRKYHYNVLNLGIEPSYQYRNAKIRVKAGIKFDYDYLSRNSGIIYAIPSEKDKWVNGSRITIVPYIKAKYNINEKLQVFADGGVDFKFSKDVLGFENRKFKTESEMSFKEFYGILKFGIKYNW